MPRSCKAKKAVVSCEKPQVEEQTSFEAWIAEWGNPYEEIRTLR